MAKQLVNNEFLKHRDKRVRAIVSCCLADILKLYAVDQPPYSDNELKVKSSGHQMSKRTSYRPSTTAGDF